MSQRATIKWHDGGIAPAATRGHGDRWGTRWMLGVGFAWCALALVGAAPAGAAPAGAPPAGTLPASSTKGASGAGGSAAGATPVAGAPVAGGAPAPVAASSLLPVGSVAPVFTATAHDGHVVDLAKLKGHYVVLYFYPKDDTPGCTKEACEFRDTWGVLQKQGVAVYGVSTQGMASHQAFAEKHHIPFPLIPDEKGALAAQYQVPVLDGKARRITYLIGPDGRIRQVWPSVNPIGHAAEVMKAIGLAPMPAK